MQRPKITQQDPSGRNQNSEQHARSRNTSVTSLRRPMHQHSKGGKGIRDTSFSQGIDTAGRSEGADKHLRCKQQVKHNCRFSSLAGPSAGAAVQRWLCSADRCHEQCVASEHTLLGPSFTSVCPQQAKMVAAAGSYRYHCCTAAVRYCLTPTGAS